ncbi:MAG: hypothetical protein WAT39_11515 [Planctomycetota bacterium]
MRWPPASLVPLYLLAQAVLIAGWWLWLWWSPAARAPFIAGDCPEATLLAFALPDVVVLVLGSGIAAVLLRREHPAGRPLLWGLAGATVYATLWCLGTNVVSGAGWLSTGMMLAMSAGMGWAVSARDAVAR